MDMQKRRRFIEKIEGLVQELTLPIVPMDDFFDGNTDDRSMGRGMQTSRDIPIREYHEVFRSIRDQPDVQEILVLINEVPDDRFAADRETWPQAHVVVVLTSVPAAEVAKWIEQLEPRWAGEGWCYPDLAGWKQPLSEFDLLPGMRPVCVELL